MIQTTTVMSKLLVGHLALFPQFLSKSSDRPSESSDFFFEFLFGHDDTPRGLDRKNVCRRSESNCWMNLTLGRGPKEMDNTSHRRKAVSAMPLRVHPGVLVSPDEIEASHAQEVFGVAGLSDRAVVHIGNMTATPDVNVETWNEHL